MLCHRKLCCSDRSGTYVTQNTGEDLQGKFQARDVGILDSDSAGHTALPKVAPIYTPAMEA